MTDGAAIDYRERPLTEMKMSRARPHSAFAPLVVCAALALAAAPTIAQSWMPKPPGPARRTMVANMAIPNLANEALNFTASASDAVFENRWTNAKVSLRSLFAVRIGAGPLIQTEAGTSDGLTRSLKFLLTDDANFVRTELTLTAGKDPVDIREVVMIDIAADGVAVAGSVRGSPLVTDTMFFGLEHPMATAKIADGRATASIQRRLPLAPGKSITYSAVLGVAPKGQMRRAFLNYVESTRAHRYRTFLHYNSWYDLGFFTKFDEPSCVERIRTFGDQLVTQRGAVIDSFLFDDGWDDTATTWEFHKGFPNGFTPLKAAATAVGAAPGVWLSPWGGYGKPREERLAQGKAKGFEVDAEGYALSGPKYFERFRQVTLDMVTKYGINQFKFDGTGSPDKMYPGSTFASDFDAAIQLIGDLRAARPDLFINLTTGTWPSPFWLRYADATWRGGEDHSFAGVGPDRQKWITYRDGDTWAGVVKQGPLYPINSLMLHGLIYAAHAHNLNTDPSQAFKDEVRAYFGSGTQLQEMYITPSLLTKDDWDALAEAAKWSRANQDVLVDVHWVGGDPRKLDVYGWAAWSDRKLILTLRNPSDRRQSFSIDPMAVFELPDGAKGPITLVSPWADRKADPPLVLEVGHAKVVDLAPFEVRTLESASR